MLPCNFSCARRLGYKSSLSQASFLGLKMYDGFTQIVCALGSRIGCIHHGGISRAQIFPFVLNDSLEAPQTKKICLIPFTLILHCAPAIVGNIGHWVMHVRAGMKVAATSHTPRPTLCTVGAMSVGKWATFAVPSPLWCVNSSCTLASMLLHASGTHL